MSIYKHYTNLLAKFNSIYIIPLPQLLYNLDFSCQWLHDLFFSFNIWFISDYLSLYGSYPSLCDLIYLYPMLISSSKRLMQLYYFYFICSNSILLQYVRQIVFDSWGKVNSRVNRKRFKLNVNYYRIALEIWKLELLQSAYYKTNNSPPPLPKSYYIVHI